MNGISRFFPVHLTTLIILGCSSLSWNDPVAAEIRYGNLERLGLTEVWAKPVGVGNGGRVTGVTLHVSTKNQYDATQVKDKFGRLAFFADNDPLGVYTSGGYNRRKRLADLKQAELAALGLSPEVEQMSVPQSTLYVRSNLGTVTAIDAESGFTKWVAEAGTRGYPSYAVGASDQYVVAISSTKMYLLSAEDGQQLDSNTTRNLPTGSPVIDGENIYLPTWKGLIEIYSTEKLGAPTFTLGSSGRVTGSIVVSPDAISWANSSGQYYVSNRGRPGLRYRLQTNDHISAPGAFQDGTLYLASLDGFVYAVEVKTGKIKWRLASGGSIKSTPLVVDNMVYVVQEDGLLVAVDTVSGTETWNTPNVDHLVSAGKSTLYCVSGGNRLTALNMNSGQILGSVRLGRSRPDIVISNAKTDRMYLSVGGIIHCLRESSQPSPLVRQPDLSPPAASSWVKKPEVTENEEPVVLPSEDLTPSAGVESVDDGSDAAGDDNVFGDFGDDEGDDFGLGSEEADMGTDESGSSDEDDLFGDF